MEDGILYHNSQQPVTTAIVVLHEIYGRNQHILDFCEMLRLHGYFVTAPNFLGIDQPFDYGQASVAYSYFQKQIGFDQAAAQVRAVVQELRENYERVLLIGFSIGATTAWILSNEAGMCDGVVCMYGSRIRDYLQLEPLCPTLVINPTWEQSFDVRELHLQLQAKHNVLSQLYPGEHGFCDPYGKAYCEQSSQLAFTVLLKFIRQSSFPGL